MSGVEPFTIECECSRDAGDVEWTEAEQEAYAAAVAVRLLEAFPGAEVLVTMADFAKIRVSGCDEEATLHEVRQICNAIWDDGDFWP